MGRDAVATGRRMETAPTTVMGTATVTVDLVDPADVAPDLKVAAVRSEVASAVLPTTAASSACGGRCASSRTSSS